MLLALALTAFAVDPIALDAGKGGGEVFEGFSLLTKTTCHAPGCRWTTPATSSQAGNLPEALTGDSVTGGQLHLDLPPGEYVGRAYIGAPSGVAQVVHLDPRTISVNGQEVYRHVPPQGLDYLASAQFTGNVFPHFQDQPTVYDRQHAPRQDWIPLRFSVVDDGAELSVEGAPLQALLIAPAADLVELEVLAEAARAAQRLYFMERIEPEALLQPAPSAGEGPLEVTATHWREIPDAEDATTDLTLSLDTFAGVRTGQVLWFFGGDDDLSVRLEGFDDSNGLEVELGQVHWLDDRATVRAPHAPLPAFVRPISDSLRGGQGVPIGLSVTAVTRDDARRGRREQGTLVVQRGSETLRVPLAINVQKIELDPLPFPIGFFADLRKTPSQVLGQESSENLAIFRADVHRMRERGFDTIGVRRVGGWDPIYNSLNPGMNAGALPALAEIWRDAGGGEFFWLDPHFLAARQGVFRGERMSPSALEMLGSITAETGAILFTYDEQGQRDPDVRPLIQSFHQDLRNANPSVQLAGALPHPLDLTIGASFDYLVFNGHRQWSNQSVFSSLRAAGQEPWGYNHPDGRAAPVTAWAKGVSGLLQWHWNDTLEQPFSPATGRLAYGATYLAPGGDDVWMGTLVEAFTEGMIDARVMATLERVADEATARGDDASRAHALLDAFRLVANANPGTGPYTGWVIPEDRFDDLRTAATREIERLQRRKRLRTSFQPERGELVATVVPLHRKARPDTVPHQPPQIEATHGPAPTIDGALDDDVWATAHYVATPFLSARAETLATGQLAAALTEAGVALSMTTLERESHASILLDPDGLAQRFFRVDIPAEDGPVTVATCSFQGVIVPIPQRVKPYAAPCRETGLPVGQRRGDAAELLIPWAAMPYASSELGLSWSIEASREHQASSRPDGSTRLAVGVQQSQLDAPRLTVRGRVDVASGVWHVFAALPDDYEAEELVWNQWHLGQRVASGTVALEDGARRAEWTLPLTDYASSVIDVRVDNPSPIDAAGVATLPEGVLNLFVSTLVRDGVVHLGSEVYHPLRGVTVTSFFGDTVLGQTEIDIAPGVTDIRLEGALGDRVRLTLPTSDGEPVEMDFPLVPFEP